MPTVANNNLRRWSESLLELGRMRLAAEKAPPEKVVEIDLTPYGVRPGDPPFASATVFEMRDNLDMLIENLVVRIREGNVAKMMEDPFPEKSMMLVVLLARRLADESKPAAN
jgi:hypothetical protein